MIHRKQPARSRLLSAGRLSLIGIIATLGCGGCQVARHSRETQAAHPRSDIVVTPDQFRLRMRALVNPMCGQIEESADAIMARSKDPKVQMAALEWKMQAVPALRESLFESNPAMAAFDTMALCVQMAEYFEKGPGKEQLGEASAEAAATCRRMEREFEKVVASGTKSGDVSGVADLARRWGAEHPIRYGLAYREGGLSRIYERDAPPESLSPGEAFAEANSLLDDLNRRIEVYSDQFFRQARWESERFKRELFEELQARELIPSIDRTARSMEQIASTLRDLAPDTKRAVNLAETMPEKFASERQSILKGVHDELTRVTEAIGTERKAALEQFGRERALAVDALRDVLTQQRRELSQDADTIAADVTERAAKRVAVMLGISMAVAILTALLLVLLPRRMARRVGGS